MTARFAPITAFLLASAAAAQVPPALFVQTEGQPPEALVLASVRIDVRVVGHLAQTSTTLTFGNTQARPLAGDLYFPLPEGVTVSGYALDVQGRMVDASVVEKRQARQVFEKVVRQGLDPGLAEWVAGNTFRTRVFPIPANGSRTVRLDYVGPLVESPEGAAYHLPLDFSRPVKDLTLRVEVARSTAEPRVRAGGPANFAFGRWRDSWVAEATVHDTSLTEDLLVALPEGQEQRQVVEQSADGECYFALFDLPPVPDAANATAPQRVTVLWDASGSRGRQAHDREIGLLEAYLARQGRAPVRVDLVLFRHRVEAPRVFAVRDGTCPELYDALRHVAYDGGTQLGDLPGPAAVDPPDLYLLFTDGLSTYGRAAPGEFGAPVWALSAAPTANHALLRHLADRTGGQYLALPLLTDDQVLEALGHPVFAFLRADADSGQVADLLPGSAQAVLGSFALAGRLLAPEADVAVVYGRGGKVTHRSRFHVSRAGAGQGEVLRCFWAQRQADELVADPDADRAELVALGQRHGLVTPGTSLIVLDNVDQYVENRIRPPASLADMRKEYDERVAQLAQHDKQDKEERLQQVLALWQQRVAWWETEFKYPKGFRYEGEEGRSSRDEARRSEDRGAMAAPDEGPAAAAPASPAQRLLSAVASGLGGARDEAAGTGQTEASREETAEQSATQEPAIAIEPWDPDTPYLEALRAAPAAERFAVYVEQRRQHGGAPAFYLDCADFFLKEKDTETGLQVLSNVAELELENAALLRVLAHRLAQLDSLDLAADLFERVLALRPDEPQSARDLALVLARRAQAAPAGAAALGDYRRAVDLLYRVISEPWERFPEIQVVALMELNRLLPVARAAGLDDPGVDLRLVRLLDVDLRIVLTWDADLTDMDLWVVEPSGEKAYYSHPLTTIGGHVSRDFTEGYGPEEYCLRRAPHGEYRMQANYYGSRAPTLAGAVTLQAEVYTNYGRPNEQRRALTLRLEQRKDTVSIGVAEF